MNWNAKLPRVTRIRDLFPVLYLTLFFAADQKRADVKKATGSDDSDGERPKKKSAANGKVKRKR